MFKIAFSLSTTISTRNCASAGAKIDVYAPDQTLLGQIVDFPAPVTNLTFGGRDRDRIFVTAGGSLFSVGVGVAGAQAP